MFKILEKGSEDNAKIGDMSFFQNVADIEYLDYRSCLKCGGEIKN